MLEGNLKQQTILDLSLSGKEAETFLNLFKKMNSKCICNSLEIEVSVDEQNLIYNIHDLLESKSQERKKSPLPDYTSYENRDEPSSWL